MYINDVKGAYISSLSGLWAYNLRGEPNEQRISSFPHLTILDLSHNYIDDYGLLLCLETLEDEIGLEGTRTPVLILLEFFLNNNQIKGKVFDLAKRIIVLHPTLRILNLAGNPIGISTFFN
jgi:hypothetical protein